MVRTHEKISGLELEAAVLQTRSFAIRHAIRALTTISMFWWAKTPLRPILETQYVVLREIVMGEVFI